MKLNLGLILPAAFALFWVEANKPTYLGLEAGTIEAVTYTKEETLIETHQVTCRYYVTLGDGTPLKFTKTHPGTVDSCPYDEQESIQVEVHETRWKEKTYQLLEIH